MMMAITNRQRLGPAIVALIVAAFVLSPSLVWSEESEQDSEQEEETEEPRPRADSVEVLDGRVVIPRPTGWNIIRPGERAVATFRSASDERAQIEVRMSDSVSERRWERFWRSFDTDLQQAGFQIYSSRTRRSHAGRSGFFYEYELERQDEVYRLAVWHTHEADRAWVFTAFYLESRRDAHLQTFEEMLNNIRWH